MLPENKLFANFLNDSNGKNLAYPNTILIILFILIILAGYGIINSLDWPMIIDAPVFHYIAQQIFKGAAPYKDIFDWQMPGTYLIHMFVIRVIGDGSFAWRLFDLGWLLLIGVFMTLFLWKHSKTASVVAPSFFVIFHISGGPNMIGQRDYVQLLFIVASSYFLSRYLADRKNDFNIFLSGISLGAATMIKPHAVILLIFFVGIIFFYARESPKKRIVSILKFGAGSVIIPGLILFWLITMDSFIPYINITLDYSIPILSRPIHRNFVDQLQSLSDISFLIIIFAALASLSITARIKISPEIIISIFGLVYGFSQYMIQGRGFPYHRYPFILFIFILIAIMLVEFLGNGNRYKSLSLISFIVIVTYLGASLIGRIQKDNSYANKQPYLDQMIHDIDGYDLAETDTVQLMDSVKGGLYALYVLNIDEPTRFIQDFQFYEHPNDPFVKKITAEFIHDLDEYKPKLIVIIARGRRGGYNRLDKFPEFTAFLNEKYLLDKENASYKIYIPQDLDPIRN